MDYESADSRSKGCWDPKTLLTPFYDKWCSTTPTPDYLVDDVWCGMVGSIGFGGGVTPQTIQFWTDTLKSVYKGDEGRKKAKMALGCLLERDGLLLRLRDIICPVYWLQVRYNPTKSSIETPPSSNRHRALKTRLLASLSRQNRSSSSHPQKRQRSLSLRTVVTT